MNDTNREIKKALKRKWHWRYPLAKGQKPKRKVRDSILLQILNSDLIANNLQEDRRDILGTALILWAESLRQDPPGTLPALTDHLAFLAGYGNDYDAFQDAFERIIPFWPECEVDLGDGRIERRFASPIVASFLTGNREDGKYVKKKRK